MCAIFLVWFVINVFIPFGRYMLSFNAFVCSERVHLHRPTRYELRESRGDKFFFLPLCVCVCCLLCIVFDLIAVQFNGKQLFGTSFLLLLLAATMRFLLFSNTRIYRVLAEHDPRICWISERWTFELFAKPKNECKSMEF